MSPGPRNLRIDTLRGVSILLVLLHHFNIAYVLRDTTVARAFGWDAMHAVVRVNFRHIGAISFSA